MRLRPECKNGGSDSSRAEIMRFHVTLIYAIINISISQLWKGLETTFLLSGLSLMALNSILMQFRTVVIRSNSIYKTLPYAC